jgi:hypothetical protein
MSKAKRKRQRIICTSHEKARAMIEQCLWKLSLEHLSKLPIPTVLPSNEKAVDIFAGDRTLERGCSTHTSSAICINTCSVHNGVTWYSRTRAIDCPNALRSQFQLPSATVPIYSKVHVKAGACSIAFRRIPASATAQHRWLRMSIVVCSGFAATISTCCLQGTDIAPG